MNIRSYHVALLAVVPLAGFLTCMGCVWPWQFAYSLTVGWVYFLGRVVPRIAINTSAAWTALAAFLVFCVGLHLMLKWLVERTWKSEPTATRVEWKVRWTLSIASLVVLMFAAGIATVGAVHQVGWLWRSPEPMLTGGIRIVAARSQSSNNLKTLALGVHNWSEAHGREIPPGYTVDQFGRPLHGWLTMLLGEIEQNNVFRMVVFDKPWNDPANNHAVMVGIATFHSPGIAEQFDAAGNPLSHYAGNSRVFPPGKGLRIPDDFKDGTSNTIMIGEVSTGFRPWSHPLNLRDPARGLGKAADKFGGPWSNGMTQIALADGSVRSVAKTVSRATLKAAATPAAGDVLGDDW